MARLLPAFSSLTKDASLLPPGGMPGGMRPVQERMQAGTWRSLFRGQGMEFESVRGYVPGDEVRHIDWRVTARTGKPHVKIFHEEHQRRVLMVVDDSSGMHFGTRKTFKNVVAARVAALLGGRACADGEAVGGVVFRLESEGIAFSAVTPRAGRTSLLRVLRLLSREGQESEQGRHAWSRTTRTGLAGLCDMLVRGQSFGMASGGELIFLSDFRALPPHDDADTMRAFARLARAYDVTLVAVSDPADRSLSPVGNIPIADDDGRPVLLHTGHPALQQRWRDLWEAQRQRLEMIATRYQMRLLTLETTDDVPIALLQSLRVSARPGKSARVNAA